jgi:hypothetical protein
MGYGEHVLKDSRGFEWQRRQATGSSSRESSCVRRSKKRAVRNARGRCACEQVANPARLDGRLGVRLTAEESRRNLFRGRPELWPDKWILHNGDDPALWAWEFLAKTSITKMDHPPYSPDLDSCDF